MRYFSTLPKKCLFLCLCLGRDSVLRIFRRIKTTEDETFKTPGLKLSLKISRGKNRAWNRDGLREFVILGGPSRSRYVASCDVRQHKNGQDLFFDDSVYVWDLEDESTKVKSKMRVGNGIV